MNLKGQITPKKLKAFLGTLPPQEEVHVRSPTHGLLAQYLKQLFEDQHERDVTVTSLTYSVTYKTQRYRTEYIPRHEEYIPDWYVNYLEQWGVGEYCPLKCATPTVEEMTKAIDEYNEYN